MSQSHLTRSDNAEMNFVIAGITNSICVGLSFRSFQYFRRCRRSYSFRIRNVVCIDVTLTTKVEIFILFICEEQKLKIRYSFYD